MYRGVGQTDISMAQLENLPMSAAYQQAHIDLASLALPASTSPGGLTPWLNENAKTLAIVAGVGLGVLLLMKVAR